MKLLLSVKHWLLFGAMFGIQLVLKFLYLKPPSDGDISNYLLINAVGVAISFIIFFIWIWSISVTLGSKAKLEEKLNPIPFKICFSIIIVNTIASVAFIIYFVSIANYVMPILALITMALIIYCLLFTARSLKSIELGKVVSMSDSVGDFFLLFIFPVGVWFIQPRVNNVWSKL